MNAAVRWNHDASPCPRVSASRFQPGDLLAFYGRDLVSRVIELATCGPSHVGIVCDMGGPMLVESTTLCELPCAVTGECLAGVQAHRPWDRIGNYVGRVVHVPLSPVWRLSRSESEFLTAMLAQHWIGKPYELAGAILSGTRLLKWSRLLPYPDGSSAFCSHLVAACLQRLGRMPLRRASAFNPASLIRLERRLGVYERPRGLTTALRLVG